MTLIIRGALCLNCAGKLSAKGTEPDRLSEGESGL